LASTFFSFFFQAEDGIRDFHVTGVQTCALPISRPSRSLCSVLANWRRTGYDPVVGPAWQARPESLQRKLSAPPSGLPIPAAVARSEERRVGKEGRSQRPAEHQREWTSDHTPRAL